MCRMKFDLIWLAALVVVLFFGVLAYMMGAHMKEHGQWASETELARSRTRAETVQATVLRKRKRWQEGRLSTQPVALDYLATFALEDGSELELVLPDERHYLGLAERECGTLQYDGQRYVSFEPEDSGLRGFIREFREENARVKARSKKY